MAWLKDRTPTLKSHLKYLITTVEAYSRVDRKLFRNLIT